MSRSILLPLATALSVFALAAPATAQQRTLTDEQKALVRQLTRPTSYQQDEAATAEKAREKLRDQVRHFIAAMNQPK